MAGIVAGIGGWVTVMVAGIGGYMVTVMVARPQDRLVAGIGGWVATERDLSWKQGLARVW